MIDVASHLKPGGVLKRWLDFAEPFEFPDSFALFSLLGMVSAAVNRRILVNPDSEPSFRTNLYVVLFGPSGVRKGPPLRYASEVLGEGCASTPLLPSSQTVEFLRSYLSQQSTHDGKSGGLVFNEEFTLMIGQKDSAQS